MNKEKIEKLRQVCKNISVLYVEDDKDIADQLEKLLRKIFIRVDVEKNGFLGLRNYTENRQDIVISDISMPSMDGIEMTKRIKKINPEQSIIITSAHNDIEYLMKLIEIGVDKFVLKPIDMNLFMSSVANAAVNIYREKKEIILEKQIKKQQDIQLKIMNNIPTPLALVERGVFKYVNNIFKQYFISDKNDEKIEKFKFAYIFENKNLINKNNTELMKYLIKNDRLYSILEVDSKVYKKYKINITSLEDESYLLNFLNMDSLNAEFEKLKSQNGYFEKIEQYRHKVAAILSTDAPEYEVFCVSLKNIKNFIDKYGGGKMNLVYGELAKYLKNDFQEEVALNKMNIYFFDRNRYVFLVNEKIKKKIKEKIESFGNRYSYSFGSTMPLFLNFVSEKLDKDASLNQLMENTEGMLYLFD